MPVAVAMHQVLVLAKAMHTSREQDMESLQSVWRAGLRRRRGGVRQQAEDTKRMSGRVLNVCNGRLALIPRPPTARHAQAAICNLLLL
jgi:hypothetical protein